VKLGRLGRDAQESRFQSGKTSNLQASDVGLRRNQMSWVGARQRKGIRSPKNGSQRKSRAFRNVFKGPSRAPFSVTGGFQFAIAFQADFRSY
jgi:hypothetical protein